MWMNKCEVWNMNKKNVFVIVMWMQWNKDLEQTFIISKWQTKWQHNKAHLLFFYSWWCPSQKMIFLFSIKKDVSKWSATCFLTFNTIELHSICNLIFHAWLRAANKSFNWFCSLIQLELKSKNKIKNEMKNLIFI